MGRQDGPVRRRLGARMSNGFGGRGKETPETPELIRGYFDRIDKGDLLTRRQEAELARRVRAGDALRRQ